MMILNGVYGINKTIHPFTKEIKKRGVNIC